MCTRLRLGRAHSVGSRAERILRRLKDRICPALELDLPYPVRRPRDRLTGKSFDHDIDFAVDQAGSEGIVLILLDSDGACPADLGTRLMNRARKARPDHKFLLCLAHQEFETWFLAAAESLRGKPHFKGTLDPPPNPESIPGAKEWLGNRMPANRKS